MLSLVDVPLTVEAEVRKPGARFQLVDAVLRGGGRDLVRAQAVRLRRAPQDVPDSPGPPAPASREAYAEHSGLVLDEDAERPPGFFPDAMEIRVVDGAHVVGHEGEDAGATTALFLDVGAGTGAVVLANGDAFASGDATRVSAIQSMLGGLLALAH